MTITQFDQAAPIMKQLNELTNLKDVVHKSNIITIASGYNISEYTLMGINSYSRIVTAIIIEIDLKIKQLEDKLLNI